MKKTILATIVLILTITVSFSQSKSVEIEATFGVRGNCGMCKATIEKAASSVIGVSSATWDKENKKIEITFDASKTDLNAVHQAIANSGYDTHLVRSDTKSYDDLPGCCQYNKEMKMNLGDAAKLEKKSCCGGKNNKSCATKS